MAADDMGPNRTDGYSITRKGRLLFLCPETYRMLSDAKTARGSGVNFQPVLPSQETSGRRPARHRSSQRTWRH